MQQSLECYISVTVSVAFCSKDYATTFLAASMTIPRPSELMVSAGTVKVHRQSSGLAAQSLTSLLSNKKTSPKYMAFSSVSLSVVQKMDESELFLTRNSSGTMKLRLELIFLQARTSRRFTQPIKNSHEQQCRKVNEGLFS